MTETGKTTSFPGSWDKVAVLLKVLLTRFKVIFRTIETVLSPATTKKTDRKHNRYRYTTPLSILTKIFVCVCQI